MNGDRFHKTYLPCRLPVRRHNLMCRRIQSHPDRPPPSTTNDVPVTNEDASLADTKLPARFSSGVPIRPSVRFADSAIKPALVFPTCCASSWSMAVSVSPGQTQFTEYFAGRGIVARSRVQPDGRDDGRSADCLSRLPHKILQARQRSGNNHQCDCASCCWSSKTWGLATVLTLRCSKTCTRGPDPNRFRGR